MSSCRRSEGTLREDIVGHLGRMRPKLKKVKEREIGGFFENNNRKEKFRERKVYNYNYLPSFPI